MPKINVLPNEISELIAAGEVVDRPASIVKELVENSIDAKANKIEIDISGGGINLIRVTDNGCGFEKEDLPTAFLRHATSKINTSFDLDNIHTLGFRGEALPSIMAVSRVKVYSCTDNANNGYMYIASGEESGILKEYPCPKGTTIEVENIFYNTPARLKFLKKDFVEGNAISVLIERLAIANPNISFTFVREGKKILHTPGNGDLLSVIRIIYGSETSNSMVSVNYIDSKISINGFISKPKLAKSSRSLQIFSINSRLIKSNTISSALEDAYRHYLMVGRFPCAILNIEINPNIYDVNVHPAKLEVRFSSEQDIYNAIKNACYSTLKDIDNRSIETREKINIFSLADFDYSKQQTNLNINFNYDSVKVKEPENNVNISVEKNKDINILNNTNSFDFSKKSDAIEYIKSNIDEKIDKINSISTDSLFIKDKIPIKEDHISKIFNEHIYVPPRDEIENKIEFDVNVIGELFNTYVIVEKGDDVFLIDKHAAHERFNYENIKKEYSNIREKQLLLTPQIIDLTGEEHNIILENKELFDDLCFDVCDFGNNSIIIREVPISLINIDLPAFFEEIAFKLLNAHFEAKSTIIDDILFSAACHMSIKAGDINNKNEIKKIAEFVLGENNISHCPHGRPAFVKIEKKNIEKLFGRLG